MSTIKASPQGLKQIKQARENKGWTIDDPKWLQETSKILEPGQNWEEQVTFAVSIGTWKRFLAGKAIKQNSFKAFCSVLSLNWQEVVETHTNKSQIAPQIPNPKSKIQNPYDWGEATDISDFYGRTEELETLIKWIVTDNSRLVAILAMGGVGKTSLTRKLAQKLEGDFNYIIWRSLREAPPVEKILADVIKFLSHHQEIELPETLEEKITLLLKHLRAERCLLILDNAESILQSGSLAATYRSGYSGYGELFKRIGESQHQSSLILTSREQFKEIRRLAGETLPVRVLELAGLQDEAKKILTARGIVGSDQEMKWLIDHYQGNPLALQIVPATIKNTFKGDIFDFLDSGTTVFDDIYDLLTEQFERLSEQEKCLMYWLAINREPTEASQLQEDILPWLSERNIIETLNSLLGRSLIQSTVAGFTLQNVVMEYVSDRFVTKIIEELETWGFNLFKTHAIIKATAKDYVRETQKRVLMSPILSYLGKHQTKREIGQKFRQIISQLRDRVSKIPVGYAGGNILNLLVQLQTDLTGYDFSNLAIRQAYLQGVNLQQVNFTDSNLENCIFSQSLGSIFTVAFSPDQKLLATGGMDGQIRLWQVADGKQILAWQAHGDWIRSVNFSPDGKLIASGSNDRTVRIWDSETGDCLKILRGHSDWIWSVNFIMGKLLLISASSDRTARVWSVDLGVCLFTFEQPEEYVWSVAFSNDGRTLATGNSGEVKLWNMWTNKCVKTFQDNATRVRSLAFSPDGQTLVGSDNQTIKTWDVSSGECLQTVFAAPTSSIWSLKFSPDGQTLISGGTDKIQLWNFGNWEPMVTLHEPQHRIRSLAYSPDQKMIAVGSDDQLVRLWDTQTGEPIRTLQGYINRIWTIAVSPIPQFDTIFLASGSDDHKIRLWDGKTGECLKTLQGHQGRVRFLAFSPNGQLLASASHDRTIKLWDVARGECLQTWRGHTDWVWSVIFSQDNNTLISAADDQTVLVWDIRNNQSRLFGNLETDWMWAIASHPHTKILATAGSSRINFWDISKARSLNNFNRIYPTYPSDRV